MFSCSIVWPGMLWEHTGGVAAPEGHPALGWGQFLDRCRGVWYSVATVPRIWERELREAAEESQTVHGLTLYV